MPVLIALKPKFQNKNIDSIDKIIDTSADFNPKEITQKIKSIANLLANSHKNYIGSIKNRHSLLSRHVRDSHEYNISLTPQKYSTIEGLCARLTDQSFWRKRILKKVVSRREHLAFINKELGNGKPDKCCTYETINLLKFKKEENLNLLSYIYKADLRSIGDKKPNVFNLANAVAGNEKRKLNEMYLTIKALEKISTNKSFDWALITFTAPPQYHSNPKSAAKSGYEDKYDPRYDFKQACDYLNKNMFYRFQKILDNGFSRGVDYFGLKVIEPHEDGCPHLHFLIFFNPEMSEKLKLAVKKIYQNDMRDWYFELHEHEVVKIGLKDKDEKDVKYASAAGYIYNYIALAIGTEFNNAEDQITADRYKYACRAAGCRQYSFFGLKGSLTKRRLLKKVTKNPQAPSHLRIAASALHSESNSPLRLEEQLDATVDFIQRGSQFLELAYESTKNKYKEMTKRQSEIRHYLDPDGFKIGGDFVTLSQSQAEVLNGENNLQKRILLSFLEGCHHG